MAVYSIIVPDSKILKGVADLKSIVIVGCSTCGSDSIAYDNDYPLGRIVADKDTSKTTYFPIPIVEEANRLKNIIETEEISVSVEMWPALCNLSYEKEREFSEFLNRCNKVEGIIALCCAGGVLVLKMSLSETVKIVPAMKTVGIFQIYKVLDEKTGFVYMDKKRSTTIRFRK